MIPLCKPFVTDEVKDAVCEVLDSGFLTEGKVVQDFERVAAQYIGCGHAIAVCNCTVGLEMALRVLGVGPGDEVIVPDYTYPATAAVVNIVGATAVVVDIDRETMLIDYAKMEAAITDKTKALIPVSLFGNPLDWGELGRIKEKHGVFIVEDAACSIGSEYDSARTGAQADIAVFSLHPRKFITTGEGGLVTTNNEQWAQWLVSYKHFGCEMQGDRTTAKFVRVGTNYKMSDVLAAIGLTQMRHIDELLEKRRLTAQFYAERLQNIRGVSLPRTTRLGEHSYQTFCAFVPGRDGLIQRLGDAGVQAQIGTYSLHMHVAYGENDMCRLEGGLEGSRYAFEHCLALPMYHDITREEMVHVVDSLESLLGR